MEEEEWEEEIIIKLWNSEIFKRIFIIEILIVLLR